MSSLCRVTQCLFWLCYVLVEKQIEGVALDPVLDLVQPWGPSVESL